MHESKMTGAESRLAPRLEEEFRRDPFGRHSLALQRVLHIMRGSSMNAGYVLLCTKPHREWTLGRITGSTEEPVELESEQVFTSLADAERHVFGLRWRALTGRSPDGSTSANET